jgi:hypothetical protein
MTYGVDQCRCCGILIKPKSPDQMQEYLASLKMKKPTMTEPEWRRAGYLAMPTKKQMWRPDIGCCIVCAEIEIRRQTKPGKRIAKVAAGAFVVFSLVALLSLYITK